MHSCGNAKERSGFALNASHISYKQTLKDRKVSVFFVRGEVRKMCHRVVYRWGLGGGGGAGGYPSGLSDLTNKTQGCPLFPSQLFHTRVCLKKSVVRLFVHERYAIMTLLLISIFVGNCIILLFIRAYLYL